ncbi:MAG: LON peptidase substrate-binding domain-containing protein [Solirubrobacterales bacterium]
MARVDGYPLFVLGTVLLPGEQTALHVFEPRYRELATRCLENGETFGFVLADEDGRPAEFACAAKIVDVIERYDDGELDILVEGLAPVRLIELDDDRFSYPSATVEELDDASGHQGDRDQAALARRAFSKLIDALGLDSIDDAELRG